MADEIGPAHSSTPPARIRVQRSPLIPEGRAVIPVERDGERVWMIAEDHISEQAADEMNEYLASLDHVSHARPWKRRGADDSHESYRPPHTA